MKRASRERTRSAGHLGAPPLGEHAMEPATPRPIVQPPSSWARRNWVSIVGLTAGIMVSVWKFGMPDFPRERRAPVGSSAAAAFNWHGTIEPGHAVAVKGTSGSVHAIPSADDQLQVIAIRRSRGMSPREVPIAVLQENGDVTVCAAQRDNPGQCADGDFLGPGGGVVVDYTVHVPEGVTFTANTVNGGIRVEDLAAAVDVQTINGGIDISTSGSARAQTVNGSIDARVGSTAADQRFETVNGSIAVSLPDDAAVDVTAETLAGNIRSDFPLDISRPRPGEPRTATGRIGDGGHRLNLETVSGSIVISRSAGAPAAPQVSRPPRPPRPPRPSQPDRGSR